MQARKVDTFRVHRSKHPAKTTMVDIVRTERARERRIQDLERMREQERINQAMRDRVEQDWEDF